MARPDRESSPEWPPRHTASMDHDCCRCALRHRSASPCRRRRPLPVGWDERERSFTPKRAQRPGWGMSPPRCLCAQTTPNGPIRGQLATMCATSKTY